MTQSGKFEEIEYKFLDIDIKSVEEKLIKLGAKKQYRRLFKRYVFDFPEKSLGKKNAWLRVRDEGDKVTLTYKQRMGVTDNKVDKGMREFEIETSDYLKAVEARGGEADTEAISSAIETILDHALEHSSLFGESIGDFQENTHKLLDALKRGDRAIVEKLAPELFDSCIAVVDSYAKEKMSKNSYFSELLSSE